MELPAFQFVPIASVLSVSCLFFLPSHQVHRHETPWALSSLDEESQLSQTLLIFEPRKAVPQCRRCNKRFSVRQLPSLASDLPPLLELGLWSARVLTQRAQQPMPTNPGSRAGLGLWAQPGLGLSFGTFLHRAPCHTLPGLAYPQPAEPPAHPPGTNSGHTRSGSYLRFQSVTWRFDRHGWAVADWNWGCNPGGSRCTELGGEGWDQSVYGACGHMGILFMHKTSCELKMIRKKKSHKNETLSDDRIN